MCREKLTDIIVHSILEIRVKKCIKLRGQAFVTYKDVESSTKALTEVQGFPLFALPMDIQYARDTSLIFSKENGTYDEHKRKREEEKGKRIKYINVVISANS